MMEVEVSMRMVEFKGTLARDGQIALPPEIAQQVPSGEPLQVVLQWDFTSDEDLAWRTSGRRQFEAAYAPEDSVYEQLIDDAATR